MLFVFVIVFVFVLVFVFIVVVMAIIFFMNVLMVMLMHVFVFGHAVYGNFCMSSRDAALNGRNQGIGNDGNAQCIEGFFAGPDVTRCFGKSGSKHVARGSHVALDVHYLHLSVPPM